MNPRRTPITLFLVMTCMTGCNARSDKPADPVASQGAPSTPKSKMPTLAPLNNVPTLTEDTLKAVEKKYSFQLPADYRKFLLENNGGFPSPNCATFTEDGRKTASDVFCYFAIGDKRPWASMEWHLDTFAPRLPKDTIPIARDSCGNLWLLAVGNKNAGSVFFWDHGSFATFDETDLINWPRVAESFPQFRENLAAYDTTVEKGTVPSRYALVKQATESMSKKDAGFSTRANPGFVWHCACDDDGKAKMEFVKYEVHAAVTHTDGYSVLRAIKGLIKKGPTRLPE
jgi:SMI1 / KNR4 family (SUKH-1)